MIIVSQQRWSDKTHYGVLALIINRPCAEINQKKRQYGITEVDNPYFEDLGSPRVLEYLKATTCARDGVDGVLKKW